MAPATGSISYIRFDWFLQAEFGPLIAPGVGETPLSNLQDGAVLPQALLAVTQMFPKLNPALKETETEFVVCPLIILAPAGTDQV